MNKRILIVAFCCIAATLTRAQDWVKTLDGIQSTSANQIINLPDGGYVLAGWINDPGDYYLQSGLLVRYSSNGDLIWQRRIGATTPDGNFAKNERFEDVILSTDGTLLLVGSRTPETPNSFAASDVLIAKIDLDGTEIWRKYFNWDQTDTGFGITALPNGEAIICGNTNSFNPTGELDGYLMKINGNGEKQWIKTYDFQGAEDWLYGVIISHDQQIMATGTSQNQTVGNRTWIIRTDLDGNEIWQKTYPGYAIKGSSIVENKQGNFGICGQGYNISTGFDNLLMEIKSNGNVVWGNHYFSPGPLSVPDELFDLVPCEEGGYAAVGISGAQPFDGYYIIRVGADGDTLKTANLFDDANATEYATSLTWTPDGALMATGGRLKPGGDYDLLLTRLEGFGCHQLSTTGALEITTISIQISPNPAHDFIQVDASQWEASQYQFSLSGASGRLIINTLSKESKFSIACQQVPPGVYFYALELPDGRLATGKLILE